MEPEGLTFLAAISCAAIVIAFSGLLWAAVQDGRDERAFRAREGDRRR